LNEQERLLSSEEPETENSPSEQPKQEKESVLRRVLKAACWCFAAITLCGLVLGGVLLTRIGELSAREAEGVEVYTKAQIDRFITSVLITVQNRPIGDEAVPADMVFVASFNALEQRLTVSALAKDMILDVTDYGLLSLGEAYEQGGPGLLINALNESFALDLQSYVATDTHFLASVIDILGGIEIELTEDEAVYIQSALDEASPLPTGMARLNGSESMIHAMDNVSGEESLGGLNRSLDLVHSAVVNLRRTASKETMLPILSLVLSSVRTNLTMQDLQALGYEILRAEEIEYRELALPLPDTWEPVGEPMAYVEADMEENGAALRGALYEMHNS